MTTGAKAKKKAVSQKGDPPSVRRRLRAESEQTRRTAAVILEVLAGLRTTQEAAAAIEVSVPRYYALEARAVEGLVRACRKRPLGPTRSAERKVKKLEEELRRLRSENTRTLALLRVAQRAVGIKAAAKTAEKASGGAKKPRRRKPTARALRMAQFLEVRAEKKSVAPPGAGADHDGAGES
jgi:hypothetical protein